MSENKENQQIRTPIGVMMDMAKSEIGNLVFSCMEKNKIPPDLMSYILKSVLLDVEQARIERLLEQYVALQASINQEVTENGDHSEEGRIQ